MLINKRIFIQDRQYDFFYADRASHVAGMIQDWTNRPDEALKVINMTHAANIIIARRLYSTPGRCEFRILENVHATS
jgi:hypothetical protein